MILILDLFQYHSLPNPNKINHFFCHFNSDQTQFFPYIQNVAWFRHQDTCLSTITGGVKILNILDKSIKRIEIKCQAEVAC